MKRRYELLDYFIIIIPFFVLSILLTSTSLLKAQPWAKPEFSSERTTFYDVQKSFDEYWTDKTPAKGSGWKQFKRIEYFWAPRVYPSGQFPNASKIQNDYRQYLDNMKHGDLPLADKAWRFLGPKTRPQKGKDIPQAGMGRMNCISFDPNDSRTIWAGASFGGVWKSSNSGANWTTFPFTEFMSIGVSDIAIAPSNPSYVYAATGDANAAGVFGQNFNFSIGVVRTTDGGATWQKTGFSPEVFHRVVFNRVLVHPSQENTIYAALSNVSNASVIRSKDGGASFEILANEPGEFCRDLVFRSDNPDVLFGAFFTPGTGDYKLRIYNESIKRWRTVKEFNDVGRIAFATTPSNPNVIYAVCVSRKSLGTFHSLWLSTDGGNNWEMVNDGTKTKNYFDFHYAGTGEDGQALYDLAIAVSPTNPQEVYIAGVNIWKSTDGGKNFTLNAEWTGAFGPFVHADHHMLKFSPEGKLYSANDGGLNYTTNGGADWNDISDGLEVTQFYRMAVDPSNSNIMIAGTQDNGTHRMVGDKWFNILGGDGMECLVDFLDNKYVYASMYYGNFFRSTDGGETFRPMLDNNKTKERGEWVTPIVMHSTDPKILFAAYENIWRTTDRGESWNKVSNINTGGQSFRAMAISPSHPNNAIYASVGPNILASYDGGNSWNLIFQDNKAIITYITVHPDNPLHIWFTLSGYAAGEKVYEIINDKVTNISANLPNIPVNCIVYQRNSPDRLYIGTDVGVFTRDKYDNNWKPFGTSLPNVVVNELEIHYGIGRMRAATYGRGLWDIEILDCDLAPPKIKTTGEFNFCKGDSLIIEVDGNYQSYIWSTGETAKKIVVKTTGIYYLKISDDRGCEAYSDNVAVSVNEPREMRITASGSNPFCDGDSLILNASQLFRTYLWNNGVTTRRNTVGVPGKYWVEGTDANGCVAVSDTFVVEMLPKPPKPEITRSGDLLTASTVTKSYQWFVDGEKIDGATQQSYRATKPGKYHVEITNTDGCRNISDVFDVSTSVEDIPISSNLDIKPNPAQDFLYVSLNLERFGNAELSVTNSIGRKVITHSEKHSAGMFRHKLDVSGMPAGAYIIELKIDGEVYFGRFVKQ